MFRHTRWKAAAVAALLAGLGTAQAQQAPSPPATPGGMPGGMRHGPGGIGGMAGIDQPGGLGGAQMMLGRMGEQLGLSEAQKQQVRGILESARPEMQSVREQMRANQQRLEATKPDDPAYQSGVAEVSRAAGELASRTVSNGAQVRKQVWAVLTPEQRTKAEALRAEMQARMKERREQRGQRPPGT